MKIENKLSTLSVYDDKYLKTKIKLYGDKIYTNFRDLIVPENDIECEYFTVISIDFLLVYDKKYYLQLYLDSSGNKNVDKQMTDYLDENLSED